MPAYTHTNMLRRGVMEVIFPEDRESVSVIDFFCCTVYCGNFLFSKDISYFLYKKIERTQDLCKMYAFNIVCMQVFTLHLAPLHLAHTS